MEIEINKYLNECQITSILEEELKSQVAQWVKQNDMERILCNSAYYIVWEEVKNQLDCDLQELIRENTIRVIKEMSSYNVFKAKEGDYSREDSLGQKYLNQYVEENKNIIRDKVIKIMQNLNENILNEQLYDLIYQVILERIVGKKES